MRALTAVVILREGIMHLLASNGMRYKADAIDNVVTGDKLYLYVNSQNVLTGVAPTHHTDGCDEEDYIPFDPCINHDDDVYHLSDNDI